MTNADAHNHPSDPPDPSPADPHAGHDHGNCEEALQELYTFLDGELTDARRARITTHLNDCSPCLEVFDFEAELRLVVKHKCRDEVPESLRLRVAERIMAFDLSTEPSVETSGDAPSGA
jgi:mycothiol system anti-sigma-R factor